MNTKAVTWIIIILLVLGALYAVSAYVRNEPEVVGSNTSTNNTPKEETESVLGCYVATLAKDVYSLKISSQTGEQVLGTLVFKNFEKDSSHGTFTGTYKDGVLLGNYSFSSEGTNSLMQVIFKKSGNDFIRGYGPVDASGTKFSDLSKITYDSNQTFKASQTCVTSL